MIDGLVAHVSRAFEGAGPWPLKIRRGLAACLEAFSAEPEVARVATVEVPAAGPEAQRHYRGALERLRPLFKEGREYAKSDTLPPDTELMAVGGAEAVILEEVAAGRTEELPACSPTSSSRSWCRTSARRPRRPRGGEPEGLRTAATPLRPGRARRPLPLGPGRAG